MIPRPTRRFLLTCMVSLLLGLLAGAWIVPTQLRAADEALYFAASGQRLDNTYGFLNHWRSSNGPLTLGAPLTAALSENGLTVQYFERGRLEFHPAYDNAVLRGHLGAEYATTLWRTFAAPDPVAAEQANTTHFAATGYTLTDPFVGFWNAHGGLDTFGYPISAPEWEYVGSTMLLVQYFERARLEHQPLAADPSQTVTIGALGRDLALLRGLPTTPADPAGAIAVDPLGLPLPPPPPPPTATPAPAPTAAPRPAQPAAAPQPAAQPAQAARPAAQAQPARTTSRGGKSIIVDISSQWLYAYEGDTLVFDAPVSTGRDGFNTPIGTYAIYHKVRAQTMRGCAGGECWNVPNVPHAMYIVGGVAIHGTYWHNQFGSGIRRSHGCINLPLNSAAWLYEWAPMGTTVTVRW